VPIGNELPHVVSTGKGVQRNAMTLAIEKVFGQCQPWVTQLADFQGLVSTALSPTEYTLVRKLGFLCGMAMVWNGVFPLRIHPLLVEFMFHDSNILAITNTTLHQHDLSTFIMAQQWETLGCTGDITQEPFNTFFQLHCDVPVS
jgi:hypothetical protein